MSGDLFVRPNTRRSGRAESGEATQITPRYIGSWTIARTILDHEAATQIVCAGSALLRPVGGALVYDETVSFRLGGKRIEATRTYHFESSNGTITATFADGAPFFRLSLDPEGMGKALHHCGPDIYALTLSLRDDQTWETQWDVSGTKRLRISTFYAR